MIIYEDESLIHLMSLLLSQFYILMLMTVDTLFIIYNFTKESNN
jgi:hypothetical protein